MSTRTCLVSRIVAASFLASAYASTATAQYLITSCHEVVDAPTALLTTDLDCSSPSFDHALTFNGKYLDLGGHTIHGYTFPLVRTVSCGESCTVVNGFVEGGDTGIFGTANLTVENVNVSGADVGIRANRTLKLTSSSVSGSTTRGILNYGSVKIYDSFITDNGGAGIAASKISLSGTVVSNNGEEGVTGRKSKLLSSSVTGNCVSPVTTPCADIKSCGKPGFKESTCGTSSHYCELDGDLGSFGICSAD